jgi:hypothetical protein
LKVLQGEQAKSEHDSAESADSSDDSDSDDSQATKVHAQHYKYYYYNTCHHGDGTHGVLSAAVHVWIKIPEFCSTNILFFVGGHAEGGRRLLNQRPWSTISTQTRGFL